jgi:hypothetical protein
MSFIKMDPALHGCHGNIANVADHEIARMSFRAGGREMGNPRIRNNDGIGERIGKAAQAGAEHQNDFGLRFDLSTDEFRRLSGAGVIILERG